MHRGFQLIELMIVIGIISILCAIAYPNYNQHLRTAHRLQAQKALMELATKLELHHLSHQTYRNVSFTMLGVNEFTEGSHYRLTLQSDDESYFLSAVPQSSNECGVLSLNAKGEKMPTSAKCWQ